MFLNWVYNLLFARVNISLKIIDSLARVIFYVSGCFLTEGDKGSGFNRRLFEKLTLYSLLKAPPSYKDKSDSSVSGAVVVWKDDIYIPGYVGASSGDQVKLRIYMSSSYGETGMTDSGSGSGSGSDWGDKGSVEADVATWIKKAKTTFNQF